MLTKIEMKKAFARQYRDKRINYKRKFRLESLQFSRQLSDKDVCSYVGMNIDYWNHFKCENKKLREKYEEKLIELFGEEIIFIFMGSYVNVLSVPNFISADKL